MKILFVTGAYFPDGAGAGRSVRNLAESVKTEGHDVAVLRFSKTGESNTESIEGVTIHNRPCRNIYYHGDKKPRGGLAKLIWHIFDLYNPFAAWDVYKLLKSEKPDIINTNIIAGFSSSIFIIAKLMRIKLVHTMRDYYLICPKNSMFKNGKNCEGVCASCKPFALVRKLAASCPDLYLANSQYVADQHNAAHALPKAVPCHPQFNMNSDDEIAPPRTISKKETIRFGYIGRLHKTKGLEILLKATEDLKFESWSLAIAGTGEDAYTESLKQNHNDKRINFLGFTDPDEFYQSIDILICPSIYGEPLSRTPYEAYSKALPVIISNAGGTPEIVDHGKTGFIYEADDHKTLAKHMQTLATDPEKYELISRNAAEKAKDFTRTHITQQFLDHMETLLEKGRGA